MNRPVVLVVMFQLKDKADGGVNSLLEVILGIKRFEILVLTQTETPANERLRQNGISVVIAPERKTGSGLLPKLAFTRWMLQFLRKHHFAAAHINDIRAYLHVFPALLMHRIPMVYNIRGVRNVNQPYGFHWRSLWCCKKIITLSNEMKTALAQRLPLSEKLLSSNFVVPIYSIVDFERFHPVSEKEKEELRDDLKLESQRIYLLYVARVEPLKQQLKFIQHALTELPKNVEVLFIGNYDPGKSEYELACERTLQQLNEPVNYQFTGFTSEVEKYYQAGDIVVVASQREGMARCMIEGMSCGLPVVSFDVTSAREILEDHQTCGEVYPQGDYTAFVAAIKKMSENADLRQSYGANGRRRAEHLFQRGTAIAAYESVYTEIGRS